MAIQNEVAKLVVPYLIQSGLTARFEDEFEPGRARRLLKEFRLGRSRQKKGERDEYVYQETALSLDGARLFADNLKSLARFMDVTGAEPVRWRNPIPYPYFDHVRAWKSGGHYFLSLDCYAPIQRTLDYCAEREYVATVVPKFHLHHPEAATFILVKLAGEVPVGWHGGPKWFAPWPEVEEVFDGFARALSEGNVNG